ncbi:carbohydrate esterase family 12 protein [Aulographum hederae CBS 113979]|uniref:Carbohydrate esterase family 12 protein n=1 Tax=Aulographum hederae CBS 113979 TaxID=1176131 RepID=A0A6G1GWH5_9PEZI|nr:carbohydrate esterase family 12 protein [Aulographum hederae CBS 113979]
MFLPLTLLAYASLIAAEPKILLCSDSTAANYNSSRVLQGWGYYAPAYFTIPLINLAANGRSTRRFINEGRWSSLLNQTLAGDFVIIEMGHNDEADPTLGGKYADRGTIAGLGNETVVVTMTTGEKDTVHTYGWYLRSMIADVRAKEAVPVLSGQVPRMYFEEGVLQAEWPFAEYTRQQAEASRVEYLDHTLYSVDAFQAMGEEAAMKLYPEDKTHTGAEGAKVNAETFVEAVQCQGNSQLLAYLNSKGRGVKASCRN